MTRQERIPDATNLYYRNTEAPSATTYDLFVNNPVLEAYIVDKDYLDAGEIADRITNINLDHPDLPVKTTRAISVGRPVESNIAEILYDLEGKLMTKMRIYPTQYVDRGASVYEKVSHFLQQSHFNMHHIVYSSSFILSLSDELQQDEELCNGIINVVTALKLRSLADLDIHDDPFLPKSHPPALDNL
ncbi:hypothetical protein BH09PAT2_BH09PAT2_04990 [soil metagenome]